MSIFKLKYDGAFGADTQFQVRKNYADDDGEYDRPLKDTAMVGVIPALKRIWVGISSIAGKDCYVKDDDTISGSGINLTKEEALELISVLEYAVQGLEGNE